MNTVIVLTCLFLTISNALIIKENVVFRKTNEISTSRSMWRITLVMDLLHYQNVLDQSLKNLGEIKKFMQSRKDFFQVQEFESHFKTLESELSLLVKSRQKIVNSFSQLKTLHSRSKRSIFPFLGDVISFIAGTPSEGDLNDIRGSV